MVACNIRLKKETKMVKKMNNEKEIMKYYNIDQTKVSPMCKDADTKKQDNITIESLSQTE